jgi:hypothetical protein
VRGDLFRAGRALALPTLAVVLALAFLPGHASLAARMYALLLCVAAVVLALAALRRALPETRPLRPGSRRLRKSRPAPPATLARIEQEVALGIAGSFELHHRLRPRLRDLARELLSGRRRVFLDAEPERARAILGDEAWELVRQDREPPEDRLARGIPPAELARVVEALERV